MAWILINNKGEKVINSDFDGLGTMSEGFIPFKNSAGWGYLNKNYKIHLMPEYEDAGNYKEGLFPVKKDGKWGYVDLSNTVKIPFIYDNAWEFKEGLAPVSENDKWGFINILGKWVIAPKIDFIRSFSQNIAIGRIQNTWFCLSINGKLLYKANYSYVCSFSGGLAAVNIGGTLISHHFVLGGKWGFINKEGVLVIRPEFSWVGSFYNHLAPFYDAQKEEWGFINTGGQKVFITSSVSGLKELREGLAPFEVNGLWGFMQKTGQPLIAPLYKEVHYFNEGVAAVEIE
jgi:hypothetical protein